MKKLKVIADAHVPYLNTLAAVADITRLDAAHIDAAAVADADALIIRTRTRCNADLLQGSSVKFIGTATIGTDHIDLQWCRNNGITVANAPGCNAPAVAQYVFASAMQLINRPLRSYTLGIVGVGHIGKIVDRWARSMGMNVMLCDPPRQAAEGGDHWCSLDEIARSADIITFHTPLTRSGLWPTYHMAGEDFFNSLRRGPIVINAARGPVADTRAWIEAIDRGLTLATVVDCWEGEPDINRGLLERADIATPHIAGYSADGKKRATQMVVDALTDHFGMPRISIGLDIAPVADSVTPAAIAASYNPLTDTAVLKAAPDTFEALRDNYQLRREVPQSVEH